MTLVVVWMLLATASYCLTTTTTGAFTLRFIRGARNMQLTATTANDDLVLHTPLIKSRVLSELCKNRTVYLKLDALQPSGSFKDRGMAHLVQSLPSTKKFISSSGGNAGLAMATVCAALEKKVHVVVPKTTKRLVLEKLQSLGATVTVHGENWNAADALAREMVDKDDSAYYVSPYDNPLLWTGHASLIEELVEDLSDTPVSAIVASVGGGGLLCGILEGLQSHQNLNWTVVTAETEGAASFARADGNPDFSLDSISSVATSLGALQVTPVALERAKSYSHARVLLPTTCTDAEAVDAVWQFAQHHRLLVEPACGAALAVLYSERLRTKLLNQLSSDDNDDGAIIVQVCGGSGVSIELLQQWREQYCTD